MRKNKNRILSRGELSTKGLSKPGVQLQAAPQVWKGLLILIFAILFPILLSGQSNEGTNFWFGFMEHRDINQNTKVVMITSRFNTSGTIGVASENWTENFSVAANSVTIIHLPAFTEVIGSESIDDLGIFLNAQMPVSVYIHQYHNFRSEASIVLPESAIGNEYYAMSYEGVTKQGVDYPSEFLIVATEDETTISITVSDNTKMGRSAGTNFDIVLNAGDTYQVQGQNGSRDLTGSHLIGDKNFVVFGGNRWTEVPNGCNARDNLLEQMYPVSTWGKQFVTVPSKNVLYDIFRILAAEDNTNIAVHSDTGVQNYSLNAGQYINYQKSNATYIKADKSILIAQYSVSSNCNGHSLGDPSMVLLNSVEQTRDTITLYNSALENITENYINVIMATDDVPFVKIDGITIDGNYPINTIGLNNEFAYASLQVSAGTHTLTSDGCGIIATAYGYGEVESYSYSGGAGFTNINANPIPEGGCLNDTIFFDTGLPEPKFSFFWNLGDGTTTTEAAFAHFYPELGAYPVNLIIANNCLGTSDTLDRDLLISLRQAVNTLDDVLICEGESFQLGASDVENARYEWIGPNDFFSEEQFPTFFNSSPDLSGEYSVIGIVSGCATYPAFNTVEVIPTPAPYLGEDGIFCDRKEPFILGLEYFDTYLWQNNSSASTFSVTEEGLFWVEVMDEYGCTGRDSIMLQEICPTNIYIPNAFSPNFDGINDSFGVYGTDIMSMQFSIFDRWGELLFSTDNQQEFWDGTFRGQLIPTGVYVWQLKIEGYKKDGSIFSDVLSGSVTVLR